MTAHSENHAEGTNDFNLGIAGFKYSDLFDAVKLRELAEKFYAEVLEKEPVLGDALNKYISTHGLGLRKKGEHKVIQYPAPPPSRRPPHPPPGPQGRASPRPADQKNENRKKRLQAWTEACPVQQCAVESSHRTKQLPATTSKHISIDPAAPRSRHRHTAAPPDRWD